MMRTKLFTILCPIVLLLLFGLNFSPVKQNDDLENRTKAEFYMVLNPDKNSIVYEESAIERFEAAMKDQFIIRQPSISAFLFINDSLSGLTKQTLGLFNDNQNITYSVIGNYIQIDGTDYITNPPNIDGYSDDTIQRHVDQIEEIHRLYPEIQIYNYYVTQIEETGWFDDFIGVQVPELYEQINRMLPGYILSKQLEYVDLSDYMNCHYASDHHWNHNGARRGYEDIYNMMQNDLGLGSMLIPEKEWNFSDLYDYQYKGRFARNLGDLYSGFDSFIVFEYKLPERTMFAVNPETLEEKPLRELGLFNEYTGGNIDFESDQYIAFYGTGISLDGSETFSDGDSIYVIKNEEPQTNHNLLIYGDSYNRAIRDEIAAHFKNTVYFQRDIILNYGYYDISKMIEKYDIDVILFSGNNSIWVDERLFFNFNDD